jgi:hypothetical protein
MVNGGVTETDFAAVHPVDLSQPSGDWTTATFICLPASFGVASSIRSVVVSKTLGSDSTAGGAWQPAASNEAANVVANVAEPAKRCRPEHVGGTDGSSFHGDSGTKLSKQATDVSIFNIKESRFLQRLHHELR